MKPNPGFWDIVETTAEYTTVRIVEVIRCNATGEVRERESTMFWWHRDDALGTFIWSGGNFACDCNRAMFFADAKGEPDPNVECANGAFSVQIKNAKTGEVFYDELEDCNT